MSSYTFPSDPRQLAMVLRRRIWLLVIPLAVVTLVGFIVSIVMSPQYESSVVISVARPVKLSDTMERMLGEFREVIGVPQAGTVDLRVFLRDISSSEFVARVAEQAQFPKDAGFEKEVNSLSAVHPELTPQEVKVEALAQRIRKNVKLEFVTRNHLKLTVRAGDPEQARTFASTVGTVFVEEMERQSQQMVFQSLNFSYEQLSRYEKLLQEKVDQKSKLDAQIKLIETAPDVAVNELNRALRAEIQRRQLELRDLKAEVVKLRSDLEKRATADAPIRESALLIQEKSLVDSLVEGVEQLLLQSQGSGAPLADLQMRIAASEDFITRELEQLVRSQYPALDRESADLQSGLLSAQFRITCLEKFIKHLNSGLSALNSRMADLPELRSRRESLTQEITTAQRLRDRLKDQQETFEISQALVQESSYRIVDNARLELTPVLPNRLLILSMALLTGLGIGIGFVLVAEMTDASLSTAEAVEAYIGVPVAGILPKLPNLSELETPRA